VPRAKPMKNEESVSSTWAELTPRSFPICGKAGKYMSMDKGSKAVSDPSRKMTQTPACDIFDGLGE
jgi:hypothetical protein